MRFRAYGDSGPSVVLLHGGPGAPETLADLAEALADGWRVFEPFQRRSGGRPLTVDLHVRDLDAFLDEHCEGHAFLIGSSWGATLGLVHAARHPTRVDGLVLVGCGTFDAAAREQVRQTRRERLGSLQRARLTAIREALESGSEQADVLFGEAGAILGSLDDFDPLPGPTPACACDYRGYQETWADVLRLEQEGEMPALFAAIQSPVLMLHGAFDSHPGAAIRDSLRPHVPHLAYREFPRCGHYPWRERHARAQFLAELRTQLTEWCAPVGAP